MRPFRSFLLLLGILALLAGGGVYFNESRLFPQLSDFIDIPVTDALPDSAAQGEISPPSDTLTPADTVIVSSPPADTAIAVFDPGIMLQRDSQLRIMYYGDSQIEGDKITARLRKLLRERTGGSGPGLFLPVMPLMYTESYWLRSDPQWKRYTILSKQGKDRNSNTLGPFMASCRYLPEGVRSASPVKASFSVRPSPAADSLVARYENIRIMYGLTSGDVKLSIAGDGKELFTGPLPQGRGIQEFRLALGMPREVEVQFTGRVSPDIYGISIESDTGTVIDNIPQRGSAGLEFTMVSSANLEESFSVLKPDIIILHYGINVVRNVRDDYSFYRKGLERQILHLGKVAPGAAIVVASLPDMAQTAGDSIVPFRNIKAIVETQKQAAANTGSVFWDCHAAMGGEGSVIAWAEHDPPLVGKDLVHLSYRGADSLATLMSADLFGIEGHRAPKVDSAFTVTAVEAATQIAVAPVVADPVPVVREGGKLKALAEMLLSYDPGSPMIFTSPGFWVFMLAVLAFYSVVYRRHLLRNAYLLLVSLFFYYKTGGLFLVLLLIVTLIDFTCGLLIGLSGKKVTKRLFLLFSIISNLGILAYFKYSAFIAETINSLFGTGIHAYDLLAELSNSWLGTSFSIESILLPVGVSFFTFQSLSYTIDVYRGRIEPVRNVIDFGFYVSFFPQLVAGPIVRASEFIPQLRAGFSLSGNEFGHALFLISKGLIKKIIISDFIAVNLIDRVFDSPAAFSGFENLLAVYGYGLQIYCDFSGYTDIAIGIGLIFGFRLPLNFNSPYKAADVSDFWKRWHISLSRWLKDYLYIPLGGNRKGKIRTGLNLMVTMVLGGLWHGASLRFIVWGALHGAGLIMSRVFSALSGDFMKRNGLTRALMVLLTFNFVNFCWIFFRAPDSGSIAAMFAQIGGSFSPGSWDAVLQAYSGVIVLIAAGYFIHLLPENIKEWYRGLFIGMPLLIQTTVVLLVAVLLWQMRSAEVLPFIYFRF